MLFNSLVFALFLPTVFALYWGIGASRWWAQNILIVAASYVFYGWWDPRFLLLIIVSSATDYVLGAQIFRCQVQKTRRRLLFLSLTVNLGILGVFKYFNFFVDSARSAFESLGFAPPAIALEIILPVGISFYTFQTVSYSIDIYRKRLEPIENVATFFAFTAFFPQLVAGPIERAKRLLPQFARPRHFDPAAASDGLRQMLWGFVKKVMIADNLAPHVELAFTQYETLDGVALGCGALLFSVQLYCDFSGYSDMAIGMSRLFGINLSQNFAYPYFARTMREFWRRWHISLSTWFRDYVYIPLGGARVSPQRAAINVLIVFGVSGLWHGANWTFVIWGILNGLYTLPALLRNQAVPDAVAGDQGRLPTVGELSGMIRTMALWTFGLVFFRADTVSHAGGFFAQGLKSPWLGHVDHGQFLLPLLAGFGLICVEWFNRDRPHTLSIEAWPVTARWATYIGLGLALIIFGNVHTRAFVYFQF